MFVHHLAGPILAVEVADDAVAGLDDGEEVLLGGDLGVVAVAEGDPAAPLLGHPLHLRQPPLPQRLQVVVVEAVEGRDLLVDLVLHGLRHRQHLLLDDLLNDGVRHWRSGGLRKQLEMAIWRCAEREKERERVIHSTIMNRHQNVSVGTLRL